MADVVVTPGSQTSEYKLAKAASILAYIVSIVGLIDLNLPASWGQNKYVAGAITAVGIIGKVLTSLGYGTSRATVKTGGQS